MLILLTIMQITLCLNKKGHSGVNFINIIRTNFSYERCFSSYVLALLKNSYEKRARIRLKKFTTEGGGGGHFFNMYFLKRNDD